MYCVILYIISRLYSSKRRRLRFKLAFSYSFYFETFKSNLILGDGVWTGSTFRRRLKAPVSTVEIVLFTHLYVIII